MVCSHVFVLRPLLISHPLAAVCAVDEPGGFDLEPPGVVWQELWLMFLLLSDETRLWECSRAGLLLDRLGWWVFFVDLTLLGPVFDVEEVIKDTLLQLPHHCYFRGSLQLVPILRRDLGSLYNGRWLTRQSWDALWLWLSVLGLFSFLNNWLFPWHFGERWRFLYFLRFLLIIIIFEFYNLFWAVQYL